MEWDRGRIGFGDPGGIGFVCQEVGDRLFHGHGQRDQKRGEDERSLQVQGGRERRRRRETTYRIILPISIPPAQ